jgi:hypothetical protein
MEPQTLEGTWEEILQRRVNFQPSDLSERVSEAFTELLDTQASSLNQ